MELKYKALLLCLFLALSHPCPSLLLPLSVCVCVCVCVTSFLNKKNAGVRCSLQSYIKIVKMSKSTCKSTEVSAWLQNFNGHIIGIRFG